MVADKRSVRYCSIRFHRAVAQQALEKGARGCGRMALEGGRLSMQASVTRSDAASHLFRAGPVATLL